MASQVEIMMEEGDKTCAFLSVPSVYFSVKNKEIKSRCKNLDVSFLFPAHPLLFV